MEYAKQKEILNEHVCQVKIMIDRHDYVNRYKGIVQNDSIDVSNIIDLEQYH